MLPSEPANRLFQVTSFTLVWIKIITSATLVPMLSVTSFTLVWIKIRCA